MRGKGNLRLLAVIAAAALTMAVAGAAFASAAAPVPTQFAWIHAGFLENTPAPTYSASLCLIDTGVNVNPGTAQALTTREALAGGSPNDAVGHGTMLAQSVASPGYGFAGLWPRIHIISERATDGSDQAPASLVISAIKRCITLDASVINISLTTSDITANERKSFEAAIASALANNIIVVAAAGNDNGGAVQYPAALPGVLAVAASKSSGRTCSLSATGPQIALSAPGCDLDISGADGSLEGGEGTSFSSVYVAAAATALRAYSGLGAAAITNILLHSANDVAGNHVLDIAAAFQEAGLSAMTSSAHAHQRRHQS